MNPEYQRQGSGPAFVYVAGVEGTGKLFYKQAADLARDHTIITFPLRGIGSYAMPTLIEDLLWIVRDAGFERATILGESFGGLLTMAAALAHPEIFERMILVNTFPYFAARTRITFGVALFSVVPYALMKAYRTRATRNVLFGDDIGEEDRRLFREHTRIVPREGYISRMRIIRNTDLRTQLPRINVPALVVAGTADRFLDSISAAKAIAAGLPRAKLKLIKGAGHTALLSDRIRVREWLCEFDDI